jgi:pyrroline-5-carboxylate reductase
MDYQTSSTALRIGFIGGGKLAGSVIRGLVRAKYCPAGEIIVSEPNEAARRTLHEELGVTMAADNSDLAARASVILIGVKPAVVVPALRDIATQIKGKLVISLAAGTRIASMEKAASARFMRAMTNTPSAVCRAATALAKSGRSTVEDITTAREIFGAIGIVVDVGEEQIDAVTALAGSGPAFVYSVIEALAEGGQKCGLSAEAAMTLATQTVLGAAQLALESNKSPEELIQMVVTPGGTTASGLAEMERLGTKGGLIAAVQAATKRGSEMAQELK